MDISKLKIFNLLQTNMQYLGIKQDVLAQNVSNANTPGYVGKEIAPLDFKKLLAANDKIAPVQVASSSALHIASMGQQSEQEFDVNRKEDVFEITPMGNKIVLEHEVMKVAKNSAEYQQTASIYRKMISMLRTALGDNT